MNHPRARRRNNKAGKTENWIPQEILKKIFPKKLRTQQARELVYGQLRKMIHDGKLKENQRLREGEIAELFGVSILAVSGAFSKLRKDGLIITEHRRGTFVADRVNPKGKRQP